MKTYTIRHEETLVGYYEIEAESPEEALELFDYKTSEGKIDFSDLDMIRGQNTVHETKDNGCLGKELYHD
jgi:hypothetical protein